MKSLLFALALVALPLGPALSQPKKPAPAKKTKPCADRNNPRCARQVDFTRGDKVTGDRPSGDGDTVTGRGESRFGSLIRVRTSFKDLILKSAESL